MELTFNDDRTVSLDKVPKRLRKLTGTRFASVLGLNRWNTPFQMWCEVTGAYRKPFEETIYTQAGKAIEPKQIAFMRKHYAMDGIVTPTDEYGPDYFKKTWGDFFGDTEVLGGMWDAIVRNEDGDVETVIECKTTKRAEDWRDEDGCLEPPEYYALQAALYAWLLDCDEVVMVVSFLQEDDYDDPEAFKCTTANTATITFSMADRYPDFEDDQVAKALEWWEEHVLTGVSPAYDERVDADYLKAMRTTTVDAGASVAKLLKELKAIRRRLAALDAEGAEDAKREKEIKALLKRRALESIGSKDFVEIAGEGIRCSLARTTKKVPNVDAMKAAGVFDEYSIEEESTRFTVTYE